MKIKCVDCVASKACKYTFGRFYHVKSSGGVGCEYPFDRSFAEKFESKRLPRNSVEKTMTKQEVMDFK